jgi:hypothetical protein
MTQGIANEFRDVAIDFIGISVLSVQEIQALGRKNVYSKAERNPNRARLTPAMQRSKGQDVNGQPGKRPNGRLT